MNRRSAYAYAVAIGFALTSLPSSAQTRWDLASAYAPSSFQTINLQQFAADVEKNAAGKLKVTVHPNASLFKLPEIKRAVQSGQIQAGEIALLVFQNEWPMFGADSLPFLAPSYDEAMKLYKAQKPILEKKLASQGMQLLYTVPWGRRACSPPSRSPAWPTCAASSGAPTARRRPAWLNSSAPSR